jgi:hypothetical protein
VANVPSVSFLNLHCDIFYFLGFDARQGKPEEMWAEMFNALDEDHNIGGEKVSMGIV